MEELKERGNRLANSPLIQKSLVWGGVTAGLISSHKLRLYPGSVRHAFVSGVLAFFVGTLISVNYAVIARQREIRKSQELMES